MTDAVAVLGAGAWGTALAMQLARNGHDVRLWGYRADAIERIRRSGRNEAYLPGIELAANIRPLADLAEAVAGAGQLLIVVPSHAFRSLLTQLAALGVAGRDVFWASKGFEIESGRLLHELVEEWLPGTHYGVVSGPSFAIEVARNLPTMIACAGDDPGRTEAFADLLRGHRFRAYTTPDVVGVELGGAMKNVLAIAIGVSDGLGFGANTRAALITRGMSEVMQFADTQGARRDTLMGLAGLGDIILTCTDDQSRNRRYGLALGRGASAAEAEAEVGHTVEGYRAAHGIYHKARALGLELPIFTEVYRLLYENKAPRQAVQDLESRPQGAE